MPLTDDLRAAIQKTVSARIGKEALMIERVDPDLIGGLVINVGDTQIDASVASRLRAARKRLAEQATHAIHGGRGVEES
jgi:F-type H+-transporting ATPase subunit delta